MQIVYIHGFNSSHRSFNYLQLKLPTHEIIPISYDSHQSIYTSLDQINKQLPKNKFSIIGHSLGGIMATLLTAEHEELVEGLVTISSPLGGSKAATAMSWLPGYPPILRDITPSATKIAYLRTLKLHTPTMSIFTTGGSLPTSAEANDSIVTVNSQKALSFGRKQEVKANHFEVLLHERTVKLIEDFLFERFA